MDKPTLVFVHGAWHRPAHFEPLSKQLQSHGYKTRSVALPSVIDSDDVIPKDPRADIEAIREVVEQVLSEGSNALVVPHSYGGIPTTGAVKGLDAAARAAAGHTTHVVGLAPIAAFVTAKGNNLFSSVGLPGGGRSDADGALEYADLETAHSQFYHKLGVDEARHWASLLRPMLRQALWSLESEYSAYKDLPVHFLFCSEDRAMKPEQQRTIIRNIREDDGVVRVEEINSDHSPFLSAVERTSDFLRRSAGENIVA